MPRVHKQGKGNAVKLWQKPDDSNKNNNYKNTNDNNDNKNTKYTGLYRVCGRMMKHFRSSPSEGAMGGQEDPSDLGE